MLAVMLLLCYFPMTMINIKFATTTLYVQSHNCISNIFVVVSYMNHVSQ